MRFLHREVAPSPDQSGYLRVSVDFEMDRDAKGLSFWFDVPNEYGGQLSEAGDPWLLLMLPIAMEAGEDISLSLPVDSLLLENVRGLMAVWHYWFPALRSARIDAPIMPPQRSTADRRGLFFSGGVDSFFTLIRHRESAMGCGSGPADTLIFIGGFDLPLSGMDEIKMAQDRLRSVADRFGKSFLAVLTNLRALDTPYATSWVLFHGCAMAVVPHMLGGGFSEVLIASSYEYGRLVRIGSHPMTDPLLSSRHMRVVHDGACFTRPEKVALVGTVDLALQNLRVCYAVGRHYNCSHCPKCLFTMVTIDALGLAEKATSFDWSAYSMDAVAQLHLDDLQIGRAQKLIEGARITGRRDLIAALEQAVNRSVRVRSAGKIIRRLPLLWRYQYQISQFLLNWRLPARK